MRAALILNPVSGISTVSTTPMTPEAKEEVVLEGLRTHDIEPEVYYTTPEDTGQALARRLASQGIELLVVAGGDGTVHAVAKGLIGTQCVLGIIPAGTMNNLARSLKIPEAVEDACAVIATGEAHAVDVGRINDQTFLEVAGIGLEASLFTPAEEIKSPGFLSTLRGAFEGLTRLITFKPPVVHISSDQRRRRSYRAIEVTICNSPYYGPHFRAAPDAKMDDGLLDVLIFRNFSKLRYIQHAISISQGKRVFEPNLTYRRVQSLRITANPPVEIQADGVPIGSTPAEITVVPRALRIMVPAVAAQGVRTGNDTLLIKSSQES